MARERTLHLDIEDDKLLEGLSVGQEVTVKVTGTVRSVSAREKPVKEGKETYGGWPGGVSVVVKSQNIETGEFARLVEDDD